MNDYIILLRILSFYSYLLGITLGLNSPFLLCTPKASAETEDLPLGFFYFYFSISKGKSST